MAANLQVQNIEALQNFVIDTNIPTEVAKHTRDITGRIQNMEQTQKQSDKETQRIRIHLHQLETTVKNKTTTNEYLDTTTTQRNIEGKLNTMEQRVTQHDTTIQQIQQKMTEFAEVADIETIQTNQRELNTAVTAIRKKQREHDGHITNNTMKIDNITAKLEEHDLEQLQKQHEHLTTVLQELLESKPAVNAEQSTDSGFSSLDATTEDFIRVDNETQQYQQRQQTSADTHTERITDPPPQTTSSRFQEAANRMKHTPYHPRHNPYDNNNRRNTG